SQIVARSALSREFVTPSDNSHRNRSSTSIAFKWLIIKYLHKEQRVHSPLALTDIQEEKKVMCRLSNHYHCSTIKHLGRQLRTSSAGASDLIVIEEQAPA